MATGTVTGVSSTQFSDVKYLPKITLENGAEVAFHGHHIIPSSSLVDNDFMEALTVPVLQTMPKISGKHQHRMQS